MCEALKKLSKGKQTHQKTEIDIAYTPCGGK
jgi:hypothetical protein